MDFLGADGGTRQQAVGLLLAPVEAADDEAERIVNGTLDGSVRLGAPDLPTWSMAAVLRYATVVFGSEAAALLEPVLDDPVELRRLSGQLTSPWAHERDFRGNRFSWDATITPIPDSACASPEDYRKAMIRFMVRDHLRASQNNLENPAKAAADGVWRDLRDVLAHAADFGGLEPVSHQKFLDVYMRHHNRLANGAALEVMEKILALIEYGLVDVSVGPGTLVETDADKGTFVLLGPRRKSAGRWTCWSMHMCIPLIPRRTPRRSTHRCCVADRCANGATPDRPGAPGSSRAVLT